MLTAIQLQTIHSIIDAVEGEGSPSGLFYSSYRKNRRAQYLTSQAHNVLVSLRDEMSAVDREVYAVLYARLENTANFHDASRYLQVAEELWEFALGAFQDVSYRSITGPSRQSVPASTTPRPIPVQPSPKMAPSAGTPPPPYCWSPAPRAYLMFGWVPGWIPVPQWYLS
ncbi:uncharacterized protein C8Q71DRAFT_855642 [Rhodofomes roseus]|uniref:Uncharacterized protein n=1 Tax=Rhodofomes roseus TaxID=34475 RepID=A0ABQ8KMK5_9APHY|nr:uncharacterized protein C8Q71DRAFT_855642 [Rhodofomes roseus]KAH9838987.1 hypothetical protein C8Q71DRAFT_855642 [Rhodofomes roseus]